jgi:hypothetical protein
MVTEDGTILVSIDEIVSGINDPLVVERLTAYPMPVQNELTLAVSNKKSGNLRFVIFNLAGLQVFESQVLGADKGDHQWTFDLTHLKNGLYMGKFVKAETGEILPYQVKVMVAK